MLIPILTFLSLCRTPITMKVGSAHEALLDGLNRDYKAGMIVLLCNTKNVAALLPVSKLDVLRALRALACGLSG